MRAQKIGMAGRVIAAILANKLWKQRTPLIATLLVTNRCNMKCGYCYARVSDRKIDDMDIREILGLIDALKTMGTILIVLSGGEPLLRDDISDIVAYVKKKGLLCEVLTNGAMVKEKIDALKSVDYLCISLDGDEAAHDKARGAGSYAKAVSALEAALKAGITTRIHATVTRNNLSSLEHLAKLAKRYSVRLNCAIASRHSQNPMLPLSRQDVREYYLKLREFRKNGYPISNALSTLDFLIHWPLDYDFVYRQGDPPPRVRLTPCRRKDFTCYIDVNANLYPCATMWGASCGNIRSQGLARAWQEVLNLKCRSCVTEVEANLLFNGNMRSLMNVFGFMLDEQAKKVP